MDTPVITGGGVLGKTVDGPRRVLDTFKLPPSVKDVTYTSDELTSVCPATGQPDYYDVSIELPNTAYGIESKSLKLYLTSFREEGMFCEQFADVILNDVRDATKALAVVVRLYQKPRGGIRIETTARWEA